MMSATYTPEQKKEWIKGKTADLKSSLDSMLSETLVDTDKMRKLTDHYRINGLYN